MTLPAKSLHVPHNHLLLSSSPHQRFALSNPCIRLFSGPSFLKLRRYSHCPLLLAPSPKSGLIGFKRPVASPRENMNTENSQHGSSSNDIACETSPLLSSPLSVEPHRHRGHGGYRSVYLLLIVVAGLDSCMYMINLPLTRVYESIACYHYYSANEPYRYPNPGSIPEILCKVEPVQQELALVRGFEFLCMSLPG